MWDYFRFAASTSSVRLLIIMCVIKIAHQENNCDDSFDVLDYRLLNPTFPKLAALTGCVSCFSLKSR